VNSVALLTVSSMCAVAGATVLVRALSQDHPSLARTIEHLRRGGAPDDASQLSPLERTAARAVGLLSRSSRLADAGVIDPVRVRLAGLTAEAHAMRLIVAAGIGFLVPLVLAGVIRSAGVVSSGVGMPLAMAVVGAVVGPSLVHLRVLERGHDVAMDLRHQLSAYLDVVTMLLAANTGYEGALEQAAHAGDGRLFRELRRRQRETSAAGRSLVEALDLVGADLGVVELRQVAATAALSAAEGAPVARTLSAKCATVRATLATDQEAEARLRTSRLTGPLVGMALIFMALVIYPALGFS
jgi:tight adherence protein C